LNTGDTAFRSSFDEKGEEGGKSKLNVSKMGLDEFLRRYTSEDNSSFQEIHDRDRREFLQRVAWMFNDHDKYERLN
jgi:hypothetical protein